MEEPQAEPASSMSAETGGGNRDRYYEKAELPAEEAGQISLGVAVSPPVGELEPISPCSLGCRGVDGMDGEQRGRGTVYELDGNGV